MNWIGWILAYIGVGFIACGMARDGIRAEDSGATIIFILIFWPIILLFEIGMALTK